MTKPSFEHIPRTAHQEAAVRLRLPYPDGDRFIRVPLATLKTFEPDLLDGEKEMLSAISKYWPQILPGHQIDIAKLPAGGELIL
jgi:hypothetical protein